MITNRVFYIQLVGIFLIILGARLWLIHTFGSSVPYWDQWDAQADKLFLLWTNGNLTFADLFAPHNEHRIVLPRLLSLTLLIFNEGKWNPLLEMVVNSLIFAVTSILLVILLARLLGQAVRGWLMFMVTLLWSLPYAWENTLAGFQSAFYLMLLFSLIATWGLLLHKNFSLAWWMGIFSAICAYFSLASGFLILLVIFTIKSYLLLIDAKKQRWTHLYTLIICLIISLVCILFLVEIPGHGIMKPKQMGDFFNAFFKALAFPWIDLPWFSALLYFPFVIWVTKLIWRREKPSLGELFVLALGGWVILQALGIAYARGLDGAAPASRYMDILVLGLLVNGLSFHFLIQAKLLIWFIKLVQFTWHVVAILGISFLLFNYTWPALQAKQTYNVVQLENVRHFLQTKSLATLQNKLAFHIPYPSPERLAHLLQKTEVQKFLPHTLTVPKLLPFRQSTPTFVPDGFYPTTGTYSHEVVIGSYGPQGNAATGRFETEFIHFPQRTVAIPVAGYLGEKGLTLQLEIKDEVKPIVINPERIIAKESWLIHILQLPDKPVKLVAIDENPNFWFAFGMPRSMGIFSFWTQKLLRYWWMILFMGISLFSFTLNSARKQL